MKKTGLVALGLALTAASSAQAQLSMQMGNGWSLGVSGNVNAFYIYTSTSSNDGTGNFVTTGRTSGIGTGLLPANLNFDIKGKEGNTDLGVHFGFFPQVSAGNNTASYFGSDAAGAQIDMRQVYLTAGGEWGQILMGKNLGLYQRGNIVNDMTIFGVGPNTGFRGTSLGRIAYGYLYTDFRAQLTYSSPANKPAQISIGVFEPATFGSYDVHAAPRLESEFTWNQKSGSATYGFFASGFLQNSKNAVNNGTSKTATGAAGGFKVGASGFVLTGTGFVAKGQGSIFMGSVNGGGDPQANDATGELRTSTGWYGQATYTPTNSKVTFGFSYGQNNLKQTAADIAGTGGLGANGFKKRNAYIGMISYQVTKSYRILGEYTNFSDYTQDGVKQNRSNQFATGMMLFF